MNLQNDPELLDDFLVYRRIPPDEDHVRWNEDGTPEPASQNFKDRRNELSVHLAHETTPDITLAGHVGFGLVQVSLQVFRDVFQIVGKTVVICRDDENPANGHLLICGEITNGMAKKIKKRVIWVDRRWPARIESQ